MMTSLPLASLPPYSPSPPPPPYQFPSVLKPAVQLAGNNYGRNQLLIAQKIGELESRANAPGGIATIPPRELVELSDAIGHNPRDWMDRPPPPPPKLNFKA